MGFDIELQDERGEKLESVGDPRNLLVRLIPKDEATFPMLTSIDPYGDTVFNRVQMKRFLSEWEAVSASAHSPDEYAIVSAILSMAMRCGSEVHLYLKFIGD